MSEYNLLSIIRSFDKWRKPIFIFTVIAAIGSIIISLSLDDYFKSTTTFYAASQDLSKPAKILSDEDLQYYGNDEDVDRIITIANSNLLTDHLIKSYDLYKNYEIDPASKLAAYKVRKAFRRNYEVIRSKYGAIEVSFEDKDPDFAAQIANAALEKINGIAQDMLEDGQQKLIDLHSNTIAEKEKQINMLNDTLNVLRVRFGIYDIIAQNVAFSEMITSVKSVLARERATLKSLKDNPEIPVDTLAYQQAKVAGLSDQYKSLQNDLSKFNQGRDQIAMFETQLNDTREAQSLDRIRLNQFESGKNSSSQATHLVEIAEPPLRKSRPKRSILVLAATLITFLFTSVGALLIEQYRILKKKIV